MGLGHPASRDFSYGTYALKEALLARMDWVQFTLKKWDLYSLQETQWNTTVN